MSTHHPILETDTAWSFLAAVSNLVVEEELNFEYRVKDVTFVAPERVGRRRKRLLGNVPKFYELKRRKPLGFLFRRFFEDVDAIAVLRRTGRATEIMERLLETVSDELSVLSLSQLGYAKRRSGARPTIEKGGPLRRECLFLDSRSNK